MEQQYYIQITATGMVFSYSECLVTSENIAQNIKVSKEIYNIIANNKNKYMYDLNTGEWVENPNYEKEKEAKKRAELDKLSLTAADVERAIYKAKGMDFEDIIEMVKNYNNSPSRHSELVSESLTQINTIDIKALKIELKANNFYRGNPYINQIGKLLGFSENQLDNFFETKEYTALMTSENISEESKS